MRREWIEMYIPYYNKLMALEVSLHAEGVD